MVDSQTETTSDSESTPEQRFAEGWAKLAAEHGGETPSASAQAAEALTAADTSGGIYTSGGEGTQEGPSGPSEDAEAAPAVGGAESAPAGSEGSDGSDAPEYDESGQQALEDALGGKPKKTRQEAMERREALRSQAVEIGLPEDVAKALSGNVKEDKAREFLDSYRDLVESRQAGQPPDGAGDAASAASPSPKGAEAERLLRKEGLSEETAAAFASMIGGLESEVAELRGAAGAAQEAAANVGVQSLVKEATDGLKGQFPKLVRDGRVDPNVATRVAAMIDGGVYGQDQLADAFLEAATVVYGGAAARESRQDPTTTQDLDAPSSATLPNDVLISDHDKYQRLFTISQQNLNAPNRGDIVSREARRIEAHNAAVMRKRRGH